MAYTKYSLTPANNNATPPDGAPEGMLPSAVNDTMRDMMAQIRDCGDGIRDGTYTMTAPKITGGTITGAAFTGNTFTSPVISGGSINNTPIGGTTANSGAFTTLSASGATTFSGATVVSGSLTANTFSSSGATITGGSINSTAIGGTTAAAGKFTTLEATGVTTVQAGTVSAPAITTSGDTNTGIYFPAADTIAFTEGGVESMRIDSSGNVGIGTSSPSAKLHISGNSSNAIAIFDKGASNQAYTQLKNSSISYNTYVDINNNGGNIWALYDATNNHSMAFYTPGASGLWQFFTANTERMRIDSSGNVGIGTTSPGSYRLNVQAATGLSRILSTTGTNGAGLNINNTAGDLWFGRDSSTSGLFGLGNYAGVISSEGAYPFIISVNASERMRITSGGEVYIAGTTDQGAYNLQVNGTGVWGAGAYVNGSDERIKDNIAPLDSGLDVVSKLNPVTYKYKEDWSKDQSTQTGFIAQELLTALEGKNYVDGVVQQGGEYMSVAYQNIIPILTKAIQEQQAMIEELKQEVALLKDK